MILKAAHGGGGRGMRVVNSGRRAGGRLEQAQRESLAAFGSRAMCSSRSSSAGPGTSKCSSWATSTATWCISSSATARCSGGIRRSSRSRRRRISTPTCATQICDAALAIGRAVDYENAGTVEFLVDADTDEFYFIEVNPRIQVEHTVTEEVTGIDIVQVADPRRAGRAAGPIRRSAWPARRTIRTNGFAIQCRVTTEDPENNFLPDYGRIAHYRSASGMGIRLDAGTAFSGAVVTPFYDSLLVKVTRPRPRFIDAARRMERCLQEFRVRGVKTNIPFLINLVTHPTFLAGECTTRFIDETPELFQFAAAARPGDASCCSTWAR